MTKKEALRIAHQENALISLGFTPAEAETLRGISVRLSTWGERLCNNTEVDNDDKAYIYNQMTGKRYRCNNLGKGLVARLEALVANHIGYIAYHQMDPRGCSVYIVPKDKLNGRDVDSWYSSVGVPVY